MKKIQRGMLVKIKYDHHKFAYGIVTYEAFGFVLIATGNNDTEEVVADIIIDIYFKINGKKTDDEYSKILLNFIKRLD